MGINVIGQFYKTEEQVCKAYENKKFTKKHHSILEFKNGYLVVTKKQLYE